MEKHCVEPCGFTIYGEVSFLFSPIAIPTSCEQWDSDLTLCLWHRPRKSKEMVALFHLDVPKTKAADAACPPWRGALRPLHRAGNTCWPQEGRPAPASSHAEAGLTLLSSSLLNSSLCDTLLAPEPTNLPVRYIPLARWIWFISSPHIGTPVYCFRMWLYIFQLLHWMYLKLSYVQLSLHNVSISEGRCHPSYLTSAQTSTQSISPTRLWTPIGAACAFTPLKYQALFSALTGSSSEYCCYSSHCYCFYYFKP